MINFQGPKRFLLAACAADGEANSRISAIPKNTRRRNSWALRTWNKWCTTKNSASLHDAANSSAEDKYKTITVPIEEMDNDMMIYWLSKFICEVRKSDGEEYPPQSVLSLLMGLQGHLRVETGKDISFLGDSAFLQLQKVLDGEMGRLREKGIGCATRQTEPITDQHINRLWGSLGDHNPKVLVQMILFLNAVNFGIRGMDEHRRLRYKPAQITLHEPDGRVPFLKYTDDRPKTVLRGLRRRRIVTHYANLDTPERCHVRLFKKYMALSPTSDRNDAFYLQPLRNPTDSVWYSRQPYGKNSLSKFVSDMYQKAGIKRFPQNFSPVATTARKLFKLSYAHSSARILTDVGVQQITDVDEHLIMQRNDHQSVQGMFNIKSPILSEWWTRIILFIHGLTCTCLL